MNISVMKNDEQVVFKLEGRLDTITAPQLETEVSAIPEDVKELVLDMEKLEYVSSAGLRVILSAHKKMSKVGNMKLVGVCDTVMEVLEITGFVDILTVE